MYHTEPPTDKTIREWYMKLPAEWLPVRCETNRPSGPIVAQSQLTQFWQIPRHRTLSYSL